MFACLTTQLCQKYGQNSRLDAVLGDNVLLRVDFAPPAQLLFRLRRGISGGFYLAFTPVGDRLVRDYAAGGQLAGVTGCRIDSLLSDRDP